MDLRYGKIFRPKGILIITLSKKSREWLDFIVEVRYLILRKPWNGVVVKGISPKTIWNIIIHQRDFMKQVKMNSVF